MKKALAVLLSVLVMFSMLGVVAFAEEEAIPTIVVRFCDDEGKVLKVGYFTAGTTIGKEYIHNDITKEPTETTEYIFGGWICDLDGERYYENDTFTIPANTPDGTVITFKADFVAEEVSTGLTFWGLVESIFARFNLIFQYFAKIFEW